MNTLIQMAVAVTVGYLVGRYFHVSSHNDGSAIPTKVSALGKTPQQISVVANHLHTTLPRSVGYWITESRWSWGSDGETRGRMERKCHIEIHHRDGRVVISQGVEFESLLEGVDRDRKIADGRGVVAPDR